MEQTKKAILDTYVSEAYRNNTGIYGKLLIIGESGYGSNIIDERVKTEDVAKLYLSGKQFITFYHKLGLAFNENDSRELWRNIAFANAVQENLNNSTSQPSPEQIATIASTFWMLLEELKPNRVLICSSRMWHEWMLPIDEDTRSVLLPIQLNANKKISNVWKYTYDNGVCIAAGIHHPSSISFSKDPSDWTPLIKCFLDLKV